MYWLFFNSQIIVVIITIDVRSTKVYHQEYVHFSEITKFVDRIMFVKICKHSEKLNKVCLIYTFLRFIHFLIL